MSIIYVNGGYKSSSNVSHIQKTNELQDERIEKLEQILEGSDGTIDSIVLNIVNTHTEQLSELNTDISEIENTLSNKQDIISDLNTIRSGAAKGATSIQNISHLATNTELSNKVDKVSGKQLSTNDFTNDLKTKLENSNVYKHQFRTLSALPASGDGWYSIASIRDTESSIVQISSGGHSDVQVAINTGWGGNTTGSLTVLNSFIDDTNGNHAYVKAVRLRKIPNSSNGTAILEAKVNRTNYYNYTQYVNIVVSVFTNAGHNIITTDSENSQALQLVNDNSNIIQEFTLFDKAIMAKNIIAETITADNLQNYKTKQSAKSSPFSTGDVNTGVIAFIDTIEQDVNGVISATKKYVRSATTDGYGLMSSSDKAKLDSFQSANNYATKSELPIKVSDLENDSGFITINDVETNTCVKYVAQSLTDEQKNQVRENIGVPSVDYIISLFEELKTLINNNSALDAVAVLDKAILDMHKLQ